MPWPSKCSPERAAERDADIVAAYIDGRTRQDIAREHGISSRHVSRIVSRAGVKMDYAALYEARARRPGYNSGGRPREIMLSDEERRIYNKIRLYLGAEKARAEFGIAA